MKKIRELISKISEIITNEDFLEFLFYIAYVLWFGYVGRMIIVSNLHIILKGLLIIGDLWWALFVFMSYYDLTKK